MSSDWRATRRLALFYYIRDWLTRHDKANSWLCGWWYKLQATHYGLRARAYDPSTGRFLSRDTAGLDAANPVELDRYAYVHADPINFRDPTGLAAFAEDASIVTGDTPSVGGTALAIGKSAMLTYVRYVLYAELDEYEADALMDYVVAAVNVLEGVADLLALAHWVGAIIDAYHWGGATGGDGTGAGGSGGSAGGTGGGGSDAWCSRARPW